MAKFYFFTEPDKLSQQTSTHAFGPASDSGVKERFHLTDIHQSSQDLKAFAICNGLVCAQQDSDNSNLVHLVLKVTEQPPFDFPYISYIIYKGIKKESLISGTTIADKSKSKFLDNLQTSWEHYSTSTKAPKECLGIHLTTNLDNQLYADNAPLDNLFYQGDDEFQLSLAKGGEHIATFDKSGFGIEVIVEGINYIPTIGLARKKSNYLEVTKNNSGGGNTLNDKTFFNHWHQKEVILNFIDPCAFWGSFYAGKLFSINTTGVEVKLKKEEIYETLLKSKFQNANKVYLDIRNECHQSINYYKNYGTEVKLTLDESAEFNQVTPISYYRNGWPLLIIDNTFLPSNVTEKAAKIKIGLPKGDNTLPLIYIAKGYRKKNRPIRNRRKFVTKARYFGSDFLDPFDLMTPVHNGVLIAGYHKVKYLRKIDKNTYLNPPTSSELAPLHNYSINNIFRPYTMRIPFEADKDFRSKIYWEEVFVDKPYEGGGQYMAAVGLIEDQYNYTFFAFPTQYFSRGRNANSFPAWVSEIKNEEQHFIERAIERFQLATLQKQKLQLATGGGGASQEVETLVITQSNTGLFNHLFQPKPEDLTFIMLSKAEHDTFKATIDNSNLESQYPIYLKVEEIETGTDEQGVSFAKYGLELTGLKGSGNILQSHSITTNINFYVRNT